MLERHRSKFLYEDTDENLIFRITVRRTNIWEDALRAVKRSFDERKHIRITFLGESAIDAGGPRREFFMLLMNIIKENNSLLEGSSTCRVLRHNTTALQNELYLCMGKMIALSIVHGGPGECSLYIATSSICVASLPGLRLPAPNIMWGSLVKLIMSCEQPHVFSVCGRNVSQQRSHRQNSSARAAQESVLWVCIYSSQLPENSGYSDSSL